MIEIFKIYPDVTTTAIYAESNAKTFGGNLQTKKSTISL